MPESRYPYELWWCLCRLHVLHRKDDAQDAWPYCRQDSRPEWPARIRTDPTGSRATYTSRKGYIEHLFEPKSDGSLGYNLHEPHGKGRTKRSCTDVLRRCALSCRRTVQVATLLNGIQ